MGKHEKDEQQGQGGGQGGQPQGPPDNSDGKVPDDVFKPGDGQHRK